MAVALIILIPFAGTILGSSAVFFMKEQPGASVQKSLLGFASGVMVAASIWSLIIPSMELSDLGRLSFIPAVVGIILGMGFLFALDKLIPHFHLNADKSDGPESGFSKTTKMLLAVTLHNIPEGIAVGVVAAGFLSRAGGVGFASAMALSAGIAIQNFPEGAIISLPLKNEGLGKNKAFVFGVLSGLVEPVASILAIILLDISKVLLPYFLSFAAGAMLFVVVEELIPEASAGNHSNKGTVGFGLGFILMMILDVALG